jgi:putative acetyltransferase
MRTAAADFTDPRVIALLRHHLERARAETAPGSAHALDLTGLQAPGIEAWTMWGEDEALLAIGALKRIDTRHGEVKSMHTAEAARRRGVGSAMLRHIIGQARAAGMTRLSLETGSWPYFAPARALYGAHAFVACPPFEGYGPDPNSVFMTLDLSA